VTWFVSSLNPAGGLKHVSWDIAVFSNFYSLMAQESGAPRPTGVWCMDSLNVGSSLTVQGVAVAGVTAGMNSGGSFHASSGVEAQVGTLGSLQVSSILQLVGSESSPGLVPGLNQLTRWAIPKAAGFIIQAGSMIEGFNCVASKFATGIYVLTMSQALATSQYSVQITPDLPINVGLWSITNSKATNRFFAVFVTGGGTQADPNSGFSFTVLGRQ